MFDFLIVVICLLPVGGPFAAVLRLARALRLLRLVSALPKLQLLVGALLKSLSAMGYVSLLLALLFYIYAVAGIQLFGKTDPVHFGSFGTTFLTLFRLVTLDNWADILNLQLAHVPGDQGRDLFCHLHRVRHDDHPELVHRYHYEQHGRGARGAGEPDCEKNAARSDAFARLEQVSKNLAELQSALAGLRHQLETDRHRSAAESKP